MAMGACSTMIHRLDSTRFEQLKASGDLPSPRGVALAIMRLTQQDDVSMAELTRVIRSDPAFVGRLVKAANGIVAMTRRPVVSVQEALMVLGLPAVRTMALGFSLLSDHRKGSCRGFDYQAFWAGSLAVALAMQVLAQRKRVGAPDELFSVGLLARVGELALATLYPGDYAQVLSEQRRYPELRLSDLEHRAFAMTHLDLGAAMLLDWGLPGLLVDAVRLHETPERSGSLPGSRDYVLVHSLALATQIAELCMAAAADHAQLFAALCAGAKRLDLVPGELVNVCEQVARQWVEWCDSLQLRHAAPPDFAALLGSGEAAAAPPVAVPQPRSDAEPVHKPAAAPAAAEELRILVVEDDAALRAQLIGLLAEAGQRVCEAADGRAGLERALEMQPHIMLVDWSMPQMDGMELIRALRATRVGRGIYILLLTEHEEDERLIEAFEAGVDDFLGKPLKPRLLSARLRAGLRVVRLQQELERDREEIRHFAAELAVSNRRLQEVALTDALTGFPNRRYAIDRMQQEWQAATRSGRPLSCMVIDLDDFKQINDRHGHDAGDEVLRAIADALRSALRGQDVICRTGGDEFLVICPETELNAALVCGERLRAAVDALHRVVAGEHLRLSISVGVAMREAEMVDLDALIKRADQGAYRAKQQGRNRVVAVQHAAGGARS